jgi:hypothetical protein
MVQGCPVPGSVKWLDLSAEWRLETMRSRNLYRYNGFFELKLLLLLPGLFVVSTESTREEEIPQEIK